MKAKQVRFKYKTEILCLHVSPPYHQQTGPISPPTPPGLLLPGYHLLLPPPPHCHRMEGGRLGGPPYNLVLLACTPPPSGSSLYSHSYTFTPKNCNSYKFVPATLLLLNLFLKQYKFSGKGQSLHSPPYRLSLLFD